MTPAGPPQGQRGSDLGICTGLAFEFEVLTSSPAECETVGVYLSM